MAGRKGKRFTRRYAKMLFNATGVDRAEHAIYNLNLFNEVFRGSKELKNLLFSRLIAGEESEKVITAISDKFGFIDEVKKFLVFIMKVRAIQALPNIIAHLTNMFYEKKSKIKATVISTFKFNGQYEEKLIKSLKKLTDRDKVELEYVLDPQLIGGIVVKIGSTMYDSSLKGQLRLLREALLKE